MSQETIAKEVMDKIEKDKKAKAEAKGAVEEKSTSKKTKEEQDKEAEALKTKEANDKREKADAQSKADKHILETSDDKLNDDEKKRKVFLGKVKSKVEKEVKDKSTQDKINKRIGELTGEIKDLRKDKDSDKEKIAELEKTLADLKAPKDEKDAIKKAEKERIEKYIEEDKDKSREDKREMSDEELNDWLVEDYVGAQRWMTEQTIRRHEERRSHGVSQTQQESYKRVIEKNPKMDISKAIERGKELKEQGKTNKEIGNIIGEEFPECAYSFLVLDEHPEWKRMPNGPELVAEEVEKRMKANPPKEKSKTEKSEEEKKASAEAEQKKIDEAVSVELKRREETDNGIESTREGNRDTTPKSDFLKEQERLAKKAGISPERLKAVKERRKTIKGAEVHE